MLSARAKVRMVHLDNTNLYWKLATKQIQLSSGRPLLGGTLHVTLPQSIDRYLRPALHKLSNLFLLPIDSVFPSQARRYESTALVSARNALLAFIYLFC